MTTNVHNVRACHSSVKPETRVTRQCDRLCGPGKETRKVTCYKKENGKIQVLEDGACEGEVPEREKPCELRPCAGLDWVTSDWSGVSPTFFYPR